MLQQEIWSRFLQEAEKQLGGDVTNSWIVKMTLQANENDIMLVVPNRLMYDLIKRKYWNTISTILKSLNTNKNIKLDCNSKIKTQNSKQHDNRKKSNINKETNRLNTNFTFDNLICGNSNQIAYAIGLHIVKQPGHKSHNPLFIYGGVGLGKTHLMQAIGNAIQKNDSKTKIRYLHANDYIQDVVHASIKHKFNELKSYYKRLDLLLMDDIQFIAGDKTKTQEEFFYTFNSLLDSNKQIIMTCDTYPKEINNLNERLISRFASGLTVEIQPPELEMRVAILQIKANLINVNISDEVAFFIAQNIKSNVRELEGALNKVVYHAQFSKKPINLNTAKEALINILPMHNKSIAIDDIQKTICDFYKIKLSDLLSPKRTKDISRPRQIAMSLAKQLTEYSLPKIGNAFGGRDHTTVMHAQKTIIKLRKADETIARDYNLLIELLNNKL